MWEINNTSQYLCFSYSLVLGAILGLIYDFFKIDRMIFNRNVFFILLEDILFWVISAFAIFSFSVVFSNGQIRGYLLFASFLGFIIYKLTISKLFTLMISPFKKISNMIKKQYLSTLKFLFYHIGNTVKTVKKSIKYILKIKIRKNIKNN